MPRKTDPVGESWYAVRCVLKLNDADVYEERITVWTAPTIEAAIEKAELDAQEYARTLDMTYLRLAQAYAMPQPPESDGSEVFSLLRESDLGPSHYLDTHFRTGREFQRDV